MTHVFIFVFDWRVRTCSYQMRVDTQHLGLDTLKHPGVEVHCLHGINVSTPAAFKYPADTFPDTQPTVIYGNGDGTVNAESLYSCLRWKGAKQGFYHREFTGATASHLSILQDAKLIQYVIGTVKDSSS